VIPTRYTEHNVCVGDFLWIHNSAFTPESIGSVAPRLCYGSLIDFVTRWQNNIKLVIQYRILIPAIVVFAKVNFFENIPVVEIVNAGSRFG
jgi:hypothetical protein